MLQDAGKKQVAAILGVQAARAGTQPRPFLKLARQHLAVQVTPCSVLLLLCPILSEIDPVTPLYLAER